jgi:hypothetical protein
VQQAPRINNIVFMVRAGLQVVWQCEQRTKSTSFTSRQH